MTVVRHSPEAARDLVDICDYLAEQDLSIADHFLDRLENLLDALKHQPAIGTPCEELIAGLRSMTIRRYPYVLYYLQHDDEITIIRILHAARDVSSIIGDINNP
ncbi:type II toxin-antitoxin system RelE/ParE family toxin [Calycomorphotria hydatis]|uniref:Plasmid stabilization system protein n=1 Tax=Calycomorphotria hydatis TaxID=2528027 RepID=A0A517T5P5_9PLAN|nr:type II toxin-antitoxin system RelE/ParE family toxin [Calycomorphotria hydatis]QDT63689.1 Plasmid stabilization system protein [Calycomorphotria hydatis]